MTNQPKPPQECKFTAGKHCSSSIPVLKWGNSGIPCLVAPVATPFPFLKRHHSIPNQLPEVVMVVLSDHGNFFCTINSIFFSTPLIMRGHSKAEAVGISVLVLWDKSLCAAPDAMVSTGLFLYSKRASQGSLPSQIAFLNGSWWP